jgi:serine protease Do
MCLLIRGILARLLAPQREVRGSSSRSGVRGEFEIWFLPVWVMCAFGRARDNRVMTNTALSTLSEAFAALVDAAAPSVVQVHGRRRPASGVIFSRDSVLTTARVLGRESGLRVRRHDGETLDAELAGWDPSTGLAVLTVTGLGVEPAHQSTTAPRVGNIAVAVARSWSNAVTASAGIVAVIGGPLATGRRRSIEQVLRTTAPMHDGFAGGAFLDASGAVAGITTASAIRGLGVVIPASIAWRAASDVLKHGRPRRGYLGIAGQPVQLAERQQGGAARDRGLLVVGMTPGAPADAAGLLIGDVLIEFDGQPVSAPEDLLDLLTADRVGRTLNLKVLRAGASRDVSVTVAERAAS